MDDDAHAARPLNAIELLKTDHCRLHGLFKDYFDARSESRRYDLLFVLCSDVRRHYALESDVFYPLLAAAIGNTAVLAATATERSRVITLIEEIENADPCGDGLSDQVFSLHRLLTRHVVTTEGATGLFALAEQSRLDCQAAGHLLRQRRDELDGGAHRRW
jgi:hypothetical protein